MIPPIIKVGWKDLVNFFGPYHLKAIAGIVNKNPIKKQYFKIGYKPSNTLFGPMTPQITDEEKNVLELGQVNFSLLKGSQ